MMTWYSYLYMFSVWIVIIGLNIYCFYRVLTSKNLIVPSVGDEEEEKGEKYIQNNSSSNSIENQ